MVDIGSVLSLLQTAWVQDYSMLSVTLLRMFAIKHHLSHLLVNDYEVGAPWHSVLIAHSMVGRPGNEATMDCDQVNYSFTISLSLV